MSRRVSISFVPASQFFPHKWYLRPRRISGSWRPFRVYRWLGFNVQIAASPEART